MANEYMNSNVLGAGLTVPAKVRKAATDTSSVNKADFMGGVAPGAAPILAPSSGGGTPKGPAQLIQGIYTQPSGGGRKI
jgi:hypothetical protein